MSILNSESHQAQSTLSLNGNQYKITVLQQQYVNSLVYCNLQSQSSELNNRLKQVSELVDAIRLISSSEKEGQ